MTSRDQPISSPFSTLQHRNTKAVPFMFLHILEVGKHLDKMLQTLVTNLIEGTKNQLGRYVLNSSQQYWSR
jgi:hypothetical protein